MKKEYFKYLYSFKYCDKEYIYLISKNYPFYFLEYDFNSNSFSYPDIHVVKDLASKFYFNNNILSFKVANFNKFKRAISNINFNISPLVRTASGVLSMALVLSMCGCAQTKDVDITNDVSIVTEVDNKSQEIYNYFKSYDMEVISKEYDGNDYIFVEDFINNDNRRQITLNSFEDFRKFNNLDFIPSWDDVIDAFLNNENVDDDKKTIILDGINNLKNCDELKDMDLSVLYVNAKRMNFKYLSSEEMINTIGRDSVYAYFDTLSGTVYLPSDKPLEIFEFIHEVLGHGSLAFRKQTEETEVVFDCTNYLMLPNDDRYVGYSVGVMVGEGGANMIAHLATNDYSVSTFYELYEEELRVISELCNVSLGELFNNKGIALYDLMYKNGIDTPVEYIFKMDGIYKGQLYCEFSDLMERLFVDATEEKFVNASDDKQNEIIDSTIEIIRDSHFKARRELSFDYSGGSINYNFDDSVSRYEENMSQLKGVHK